MVISLLEQLRPSTFGSSISELFVEVLEQRILDLAVPMATFLMRAASASILHHVGLQSAGK